MAWIVYANLSGGNQPASTTLDTQSTNLATFGVVPTTAAFSSNVYTLTPILSGYTGPAYANLVTYSFVAANASTGNVTLKVGSLAALNVYKSDGTTQIGSGDIVSGQTYTVVYNGALNSSAGGWYLTPIGVGSGVTSVFGRTGAVVAATNDYSEAQISFTDITTNNVSTTKHGYAPKSPNDATKYLDGTGAYSVPAGGAPAAGNGITVVGSTVSINTNNANGIGAYNLVCTQSGTIAAGSTGSVATFGFDTTGGTFAVGVTGNLAGTWRNVSGLTIGVQSSANGPGMCIRTA